VLVDLAELVVAMVPHADWCIFGKNGTDATTSGSRGGVRGKRRCLQYAVGETNCL
jgi:hypothetical protein